MKKNAFKIITIMVFLCSAVVHAAPGYIHVSDMSKVAYQLTADGKVYFRNLNVFNGEATGCCYAFFLDTTTPFGKSAWSVILMKMASKSSLFIHVTNLKPATHGDPGEVDQVGDW